MKILLTGSNGLLGQKLVELIAPMDGFELVATSRGKDRLPDSDLTYQYQSLDITDKAQVMEVISTHKPDAIIHTAAMTNVDQCESEQEQCHKLNVEAVGYVIEAARANQAFLLHLSTDFIFDGSFGPLDEEAAPNPISIYGQSKLDAEQLIINSDIDWAIARTVLVYGLAHDMSRSNIILWVKKSLESNQPIKVVNDQWRTPTLAEDLAMGCFLIIKNRAKGIFNVAGKDFLTPYEMAIKTAEFFNLDTSTMAMADSGNFSQPAKRPPKTGLKIDKAKKLLDYQPHSFEEGIALLAAQMKN